MLAFSSSVHLNKQAFIRVTTMWAMMLNQSQEAGAAFAMLLLVVDEHE